MLTFLGVLNVLVYISDKTVWLSKLRGTNYVVVEIAVALFLESLNPGCLIQLTYNVQTQGPLLSVPCITLQGIVAKLKMFSSLSEHVESNCSVVCLLSHGEEGYVFGTDGKKIPLDEIFMMFDNTQCRGLIGKPKVFFIQACRGGLSCRYVIKQPCCCGYAIVRLECHITQRSNNFLIKVARGMRLFVFK